MSIVFNCWNRSVGRVDYVDLAVPTSATVDGEDPQNAAVGDWLFIELHGLVNSDTVQWAAGATAPQYDSGGGSYVDGGFDLVAATGNATTRAHTALFARQITGSEAASYRVAGNNTNVWTDARIILSKGGHASAIIGAVGSAVLTDALSPISIPEITVTDANARVIGLWSFDGADATFGYSSGWSSVLETQGNAPDSFGISGGIIEKDAVSIGLTGVPIITPSITDGGSGFLVELIPAAVAGAPGDDDYLYHNEMEIDIAAPLAGEGSTELFFDIVDDPGGSTQISGPISLGLPTVAFTYFVPKAYIQALSPGAYTAQVWYVDADTTVPNKSTYDFNIIDTPILPGSSAPINDTGTTNTTTAGFEIPTGTANTSGGGTIEYIPVFYGSNLAPDSAFAAAKGDASAGWAEDAAQNFWTLSGGYATHVPDGSTSSRLFTSCVQTTGAGSIGTVKFPFTCTAGYLTVQNGFNTPIIGDRFTTTDHNTTVECTIEDLYSEFIVLVPSSDFAGTVGTFEFRQGTAQTQQSSRYFSKTVSAGVTVTAAWKAVNGSGYESEMSKQGQVTAVAAAPPALVANDFGVIQVLKNSVDNNIDVLAHVDSDTVVAPVLVSDVTQPAVNSNNVTAVDPSELTVLFTPEADWTGYDYFTYRAKDSGIPTYSGYGIVTVQVISGDAITLESNFETPYILADHAFDIALTATHSASSNITWSVNAAAGSASVTPGGLVDPTDKTATVRINTTGATGTYAVTVAATDGVVVGTLVITVTVAPAYGTRLPVVTF